jgi:hypothetical protein
MVHGEAVRQFEFVQFKVALCTPSGVNTVICEESLVFAELFADEMVTAYAYKVETVNGVESIETKCVLAGVTL